jgi:hypothetical protein
MATGMTARRRLVRGRVVAVSIRASMIAGGWVGFVLGLFAGCILGAAIAWFAGALLEWQRELSLTLGVAQQLLPFGAELSILGVLQAYWYLVIPAAGVLVGLLAALVGALTGGLMAASYDRSRFGVQVVVEVPEEQPIP